MKNELIVILFLFNMSLFHAQDQKYKVTSQVIYNKMDLFVGFSLIQQKTKIDHELSINAGINRTFFQNSFFPMFQYTNTYMLVDKNQLLIGPSLSMNLSMLNLKTNQSNFHFYPEILAGYKISYGKKIGFIHKASIGILFEGFKNSKSELNWFNTLSYHINMGIYYAIN